MRSKRAAARSVVVKTLRCVKRDVTALMNAWTMESHVCEPDGSRREREQREYPEAQLDYWRVTIAAIDALQWELQTLREHCLAEYRKCDH